MSSSELWEATHKPSHDSEHPLKPVASLGVARGPLASSVTMHGGGHEAGDAKSGWDGGASWRPSYSPPPSWACAGCGRALRQTLHPQHVLFPRAGQVGNGTRSLIVQQSLPGVGWMQSLISFHNTFLQSWPIQNVQIFTSQYTFVKFPCCQQCARNQKNKTAWVQILYWSLISDKICIHQDSSIAVMLEDC